MKKWLLICALSCMGLGASNAQNVFNEIYKISSAEANNAQNTLEVRKVSTFKMDALSYLKTKVLQSVNSDNKSLQEVLNDSTISMLNHQAYAMYDFINLFVKKMGQVEKKKAQNRILEIFQKASLNNPLYNDPDKDLVLSYYNNPEFITRFSLDTDWIKARKDVTELLQAN